MSSFESYIYTYGVVYTATHIAVFFTRGNISESQPLHTRVHDSKWQTPSAHNSRNIPPAM
jgi:hypothetical protein